MSPHFTTVAFNSKTTPMSRVTVPTPETCSVTYWMDLLVAARDPVMLVGYAGCGKTQLVMGLLASQKPDERTALSINFNYFTDARTLQSIMEAPLEKKTGTNYGPPGKLALVYYLDDFNLPEVDKYNTQSAIALVREHFDYGHWYDRGKLQLRNIANCQYIACMNPTAGSFVINPRMQRHFVPLAIGFPGPTSLHTIYSTFLEGHLSSFSEELQGTVAQQLLSGALQLHAGVASTFRKSATNFHYEFNIRHLSNVFQGLLMAQPSEFKTQEKLAQLWVHESERVYGDRLVSLEDLGKYRALALATAKKKFPTITSLASFFGESADPLVFCHFAESTATQVYDKVPSLDRLRATLDESLREYNENFAAMNLVLFEDALKHVARISRIVLNPSGHALLVGVGGSGKQSLSRLSAYICNYRVYQITISGSYGLNDLKEDLKAMYNLAGVKEEGVLFLFTDSQITNERFLVPMNDLLASGNIPDLYTTEEVDGIVNAMVTRVKAAGLTPDRGECWKFFIELVKKNLHVVLCFSPVGEDFRSRAKRFPALVNCTVIDWFQPWPKDALYSVGSKFLKEVEGIPSDAVREGIEKFMPYSFETVNKAAIKYLAVDRRFVYTTPKSYLELLKLYRSLFKAKRSESENAISRLSNGLTKLRDTGETVAKIEEELKVKLAEAEEAKAIATGIAAEVAANTAIVEEETNKANAIAADAAKIAATATTIKDDAERDLAAALPAVERAMAALDTLDKKQLGECSKMQTPPAGVEDIFAAVVVLLATVHKGVVCAKNGKVADKDRTWAAAKKQVLTDVAGFLQQLMEYKKAVDDGIIPETNFKDVRAYLDLPHFNYDAIMKKNSAAAGITSWVVNIVGYRDIVVTVEPKKARAAAAAAEAAEAQAKREAAELQVAELTAQLNILKAKLAEAEGQKAAAEAVVAKGKAKADLANRLTNALADENVRWAASIETLTAEQDMLVGDTLLAAAFISYIGPFTKKYRDALLNESWLTFMETAAAGSRIPMSPKPNPLAVLTSDAQIAKWNSEGLPDDKVSVENGCIVSSTARWPLLIDPQLQGITWVRQKETPNGLVVVRMDQKNMLNKLELAIEKGTPFLVENMGERIDAVLGPVIARALIKKGSRQYVKLGEKELEFSPNFRLYLHTKLSNPHYPPEVQAETCLVNFTVTEAGLEDQLLAFTVLKERPDLATLKTELTNQQNAFKIKMKELEDGILKRLADAEGDLTEDRELIESLENTKRIATDIAERQVVAKATERDINVTSEKYRSVAHRAALLFFLLNDLFKCHTYYIYSLNAFVNIFQRAIELVSGANDPNASPEEEEEAAAAAAGTACCSMRCRCVVGMRCRCRCVVGMR
jgi:dynein heavy chain